MTKFVFKLHNPEHWCWKTNKKSKSKVKIRGKLKKWLKKNCTSYRILREDIPPIVLLNDKEEAMLLKLTWL